MSTVIRHIQALIQDGALPVGAPLPSEVGLSRDLGISRGMVREAYRTLAATGAVELGNGRVPRVRGLTAAPVTELFQHVLDTGQVELRHVLQLRRAIDLEAAQLAASHRSDADLRTLLDSVKALREASGDGEAFVAHDLQFHAVIAQASGNPLLMLMTQAVQDLTERSILAGRTQYAAPQNVAAFIEVHERVARAVAARDVQATVQAVQEHYEQAQNMLL